MRKKLLALSVPNLLTGSFQHQRNSDIFGCSDAGAHFKNRYSSNVCFVDDDPAPDTALTFGSQADLDAYIAKVTADKAPVATPPVATPPADQESITEKRDREAREALDKSNEQGVFKNAILFETQFDTVMKDAGKFFANPESVKTIRNDVIETDTVKRASIMAATAAKEFFRNPKNVEILEKSDQEIVKSEIESKRYESDIDGMKAWDLMRRAIYNHNLKDKHDAQRNNSGSGNVGVYGHARLDAKLKSFYPENVSAL